jgi:hypothetical protein
MRFSRGSVSWSVKLTTLTWPNFNRGSSFFNCVTELKFAQVTSFNYATVEYGVFEVRTHRRGGRILRGGT